MRKKQAAILALICGVGIFFLKLAAFFVSNSVALLSDALESIINILASALMFFSISISERNRLSVTAYLLELNFGIILSVIATSVNLGVSFILLRTAKRTGSSALEGDSKHLLSDVISSIVVWVGLVIGQLFGIGYMDSLLAFVVAVLVVRLGAGLIWKSSCNLMDQSCVDEERTISDILRKHEYRFIDFHDLKTRRSGSFVFAELHLSVVSSLTVKEAHDLADHLEADIKEACSNIKLTIHVEPS
jgi:cation diffusion facilitator family transporter